MWGAIIGGGLSLLSNMLGNDNKKSQNVQTGTSTLEKPERMSYEEALGQAEDILQPQYQESKEKTLDQLSNAMIDTGFYGQAPGDAIKAETMADMESDYQSQLSQYATNLQDRRYNQDYQAYKTNWQMQQQNRAYQNQQQQQTFGNIGTGAAIGQQIGEGFGESGWGTGLGALAGWLFS